MHGSVLHGFKQFARARGTDAQWDELCRAAGVSGWFVATKTYPDEQMAALVSAASKAWQCDEGTVLEDFGEALVATLLRLYKAYLAPDWRTLDVLVHAEGVIHRTIRSITPDALPPYLRPTKISDHEVQIAYDSPRRLCRLAVGICRGIAAHFGETITVQHPTCMLRGDAACLLVVQIQSQPDLASGGAGNAAGAAGTP